MGWLAHMLSRGVVQPPKGKPKHSFQKKEDDAGQMKTADMSSTLNTSRHADVIVNLRLRKAIQQTLST